MIKTAFKFMTVGLSGVGVNMAVYLPLIQFGVHYMAAAVCSFLAAVTNNFVWNMVWTFQGRAVTKSVQRKYLTFVCISFANLLLNLMLLRFFIEMLYLPQGPAQLVTIGIVSVLNFAMNYFITFADSKDKEDLIRVEF